VQFCASLSLKAVKTFEENIILSTNRSGSNNKHSNSWKFGIKDFNPVTYMIYVTILVSLKRGI
jgi:hypothetical protein